MGCGLIPAPVIDMLAVTALEVRMFLELADVYRFRFPGRLVVGKVLIALVGSIAPLYISNKLKNTVKVAPGFGAIVASGWLAVVNGASVYAVGKVFERHFESGGTFLSADNALIRRFFGDHYAEGKKVASGHASEALSAAPNL